MISQIVRKRTQALLFLSFFSSPSFAVERFYGAVGSVSFCQEESGLVEIPGFLMIEKNGAHVYMFIYPRKVSGQSTGPKISLLEILRSIQGLPIREIATTLVGLFGRKVYFKCFEPERVPSNHSICENSALENSDSDG
jgi:hypothetical protein